MPRMLANEFVYLPVEENCSDLTPPTPPNANAVGHYQQQELPQGHSLHYHQLPSSNALIMPETATTRHNSPMQNIPQECLQQSSDDGGHNTSPDEVLKHQQHIHTISSSDDVVATQYEAVGETQLQIVTTNSISSDDMEDFRGFEDDEVEMQNKSVVNDEIDVYVPSRENLKRHLSADVHQYREDSEGVVEAIEVDDEYVEEVDGQIMFKSKLEETPKKADNCDDNEYSPHTPNKRKRHQNDGLSGEAVSPSNLKTPPDQIVEINSDSTTISQKHKRQQINTKFQLNFNQRQNYQTAAANAAMPPATQNKCSTESTSEFPVSSPSNPQQTPRGAGGKYPPRPPFLKNTLPADSFERQLAMITACNPQMTLAEKIQGWCCEDDYSDVEDVALFDEEFKRLEEQRKTELTKQKNKRQTSPKKYDFGIFRQMIIDNMNMAQKNKRLVAGGNGSREAGISSLKQQDETTVTSVSSGSSTSSDANKNLKHADERPSTSAVAQQQLQQRRCKANVATAAINQDVAEVKKTQRFVKDSNNKRNQNSTSPPATSSSDNDCFQNSKKLASTAHKRFPKGGIGGVGGGGGGEQPAQVHIHEKLVCPSSSEEANSQDVPPHMQLIKGPPLPHHFQRQKAPPPNPKEMKKLSSLASSEKIDSFFRASRLNREIDKPTEPIKEEIKSEQNSKSLEIESKNGQQLFKTPILPTKYFPNNFSATTGEGEEEEFPAINIKNNSAAKSLISLTLESQAETQKETEKMEAQETIVATSATDIQDENEADDGVYHQQHEFCNYLGLTGMSTATAMANAVAELAQCNMARRSMRVLRQQQQERKEKNAKEESQPMKPLKNKRPQAKEVKKSVERKEEIEPQPSKSKNLESSISQASEPISHSTASMKGVNKQSQNKPKVPSLSGAANSVKNEPQIKILCHIANTTTTNELLTDKKYQEEIALPQREPLMRQAKNKILGSLDSHHDIKKSEIRTEILNDIKTENITASDELEKQHQMSGKSKPLSPQRLNRRSKMLRSQRSNKSISDVNIMEEKQITSIKIEKSSPTVFNGDVKTNDVFKKEASNDPCSCSNNSIDDGGDDDVDGALTPTISLFMKTKLQAALEESRKTKPSIFIVQTLESNKEKTNICNNNNISPNNNNNNLEKATYEEIPTTKTVPSKIEVRTQLGSTSAPAAAIKVNNNVTKKKKSNGLLKRRAKTFSLRSTPKRELRARKIIFIKSTTTKDKTPKNKKLKEEVPSKKSLFAKSNKPKEVVKQEKKEKQEKVTKSYCNAQTETSDLELLGNQISTRTRLMAKASALLQRSKRSMSLFGNRARGGGRGGGGGKTLKSKLGLKLMAKPQTLQPKEYKTASTSITPPPATAVSSPSPTAFKPNTTTSSNEDRAVLSVEMEPPPTFIAPAPSSLNFHESENVVVSSTTNSYDERLGHALIIPCSPITMASSTPIETKDNWTQSEPVDGTANIQLLYGHATATHQMRNPIKSEFGVVLYIYYEVDILIVVQEHLISFWKCPKLVNALTAPQGKFNNSPTQHSSATSPVLQEIYKNFKFNSTLNGDGEWIPLGELKRLTHDYEIVVPYANRICLHNSTPIYVEMRARPLPKNHRECNLLSIYINIYYFHDEELIAKSNSIQLDNIQSDLTSVNYTTLTDSRYFIITWPQENLLGKTRSGLCKYSITPQLDTLASIREFKSMRHTIRYLECMKDDKLLGLGDSQITIWDHRSGDVLMNYDLEIPLGKHLGSVYFPSQDVEENNMIIFYQFRDLNPPATSPELLTLACTISHSQPMYRILQQQPLPKSFKHIQYAINTGEHIIVSSDKNDEIWICCNNPRLVALVPQATGKQRFFSRDRSQLIELSGDTLNLDTLANNILQLAAGLALQQRL
ncbi:uncharacterized protein [Musca autumnalis]|uniref:uncharacterized protein n=1 Tax=Musca autumnalis TaxID=221902 RepID=UPI003CE6BC06